MIQRILRITSTDGAAKVLVFSSGNDVLDVLECSFAPNNIYYCSNERSKASSIKREKVKKTVSKMQPTQQFLMLIHNCAVMEAQHVILLEQLLNPSAAQAISRIHELGKTSTFIHRLVVIATTLTTSSLANKMSELQFPLGMKDLHLCRQGIVLKKNCDETVSSVSQVIGSPMNPTRDNTIER